jgi:hypothetical protein
MAAYDQYIMGDLANYDVPEEEIKANVEGLDEVK